MENLDNKTDINSEPEESSTEYFLSMIKNRLEQKSFQELRAEELKEIGKKFELPDNGTLYYPACGEDNGASLAFPNWKITYMDAVYTGIQGINTQDVVIKGDLMNPPLNPKNSQFDVALLISPGYHFSSFSPEYIQNVVEFLKPGGLLICDNYHHTAVDSKEKLGDILEEIDNSKEKELKVFKKLVPRGGIEPPLYF